MLEVDVIGVAVLLGARLAAGWVGRFSPRWPPMFTLGADTPRLDDHGYGFAASVLPVWLLLAPRDYLLARS